MSVVIDGTSGVTTPGVVNTAGETIATTLSVTGVTTLTGGLNAALPVLSGGTGVTTKTGTGAVVLGTAPTITGATITVAATAAPAFSAYLGSNQTISAAVTTKVAFNTETFDTNSNYDNATNYRFTPTVAGYYQVTVIVAFLTGSGQPEIYKNGVLYQNGIEQTHNAALGGHSICACLLYLNGTSDYIEGYIYLTSGTTVQAGSNNTTFSAAMIRSA